MENQIESIIKKYCKKLKKIDKSKNIPYVVKSLDKLVYDMYHDLYALRDGRKILNNVETDKKGHCC